MDDELSSLRDRMRNACEKDAISNGNRQPALAKLKMLNEVTGTLTK
jgi:transcription factor SPN1